MIVKTRVSFAFLLAFLLMISCLILTTTSTPIDVETFGLSTIPLIVHRGLKTIVDSGHVTGKQLAFILDEDKHSLGTNRYPSLPDYTYNFYHSHSDHHHAFSYPSRYPSTSTFSVPDIVANSVGVQPHVKDDKPSIETLFTSLIK